MSGVRKRAGVTQKDLERWARAGYGRGERESYRPWLTVRDVPSRGVSAIVSGVTIPRRFQLLSRLEFRAFLYFDFLSRVIDIREQFPLFPLLPLVEVATELGIRYPKYPRSSTPVVLTTDFLLTLSTSAGIGYQPVYCTYSSAFHSTSRKVKRKLEKLELQRRYWASKGLELKIFTEETVSAARFFNLRALHQVAKADPSRERTHDNALRFRDALVNEGWENQTLKRLIWLSARKACFSWDLGFELFKYLVWNHELEIDFEERLSLSKPLTYLALPRVAVAKHAHRRAA